MRDAARQLGFVLGAVLCFLLPGEASALRTSENAFRLEDSGEGNLLLGADQAVIEAGEVYNTVVLLWGELEIAGQVDEVMVLSGKVIFQPGAKLTKTLVVMGGSFESKPGAEVAPESVIFRSPGPLWRILQSAGNLWREHVDGVLKTGLAFFACLFLWLLGLLLFRLFPALQGITEGRLISQWPQNLLVGLLGAIAAPIFFALLVISILGIVLLPLYLLLLGAAGLVSYLGAALWAGHRLLPPRPGRKLRPLGFLLGLVAMQFLWVAGVWWAALPVIALWTFSWGSLLRGGRSLWK